MAQIEIPEGMTPDAATSWPPRELIDSFLGNFPHEFDLRPGETLEVADEEKQQQARLFRDVLSQYGSGVTIITTVQDGQPVGMTCQSFVSVSLDPPLVAYLPTKQSRAFAAVKETGRFCANFLASDQVAVSNVFASRAEDKFAGIGWTPSVGGSAKLDGVVGYTDCTVEAIHDGGDHWIVVGRVVDMAVDNAVDPLLFFRGKYHTAEVVVPPEKKDEKAADKAGDKAGESPAGASAAAKGWRPGKRAEAEQAAPAAWKPWAPGRTKS